jgi:hypothetical protein
VPGGSHGDVPGEDAEVRRSLEMENSGATAFADHGYQIQQNPTKPEVARARQTQRVVVNLEDWRGDMSALRRQFADFRPTNRWKCTHGCRIPADPRRDTPVDQVAARVPGGRRASHRCWSAPHRGPQERYGFDVTIVSGTAGYLDLETDDGAYEWEPEAYVRVGFRLDQLIPG